MNLAIVKWILLMASAPIWLPFAKALWEELEAALRLDGGIWGDPPGAVKRAQILRDIEQEEPRLVHETIANWRARKERNARMGKQTDNYGI